LTRAKRVYGDKKPGKRSRVFSFLTGTSAIEAHSRRAFIFIAGLPSKGDEFLAQKNTLFSYENCIKG
jgi:hypothetical protein